MTTCAIYQGLPLKNGVDIWNFCALQCKNHGLASQFLGFSVCSIAGVKVDIILVLSSQVFECLRATLYMPWSTWKRLV